MLEMAAGGRDALAAGPLPAFCVFQAVFFMSHSHNSNVRC